MIARLLRGEEKEGEWQVLELRRTHQKGIVSPTELKLLWVDLYLLPSREEKGNRKESELEILEREFVI